MNNETGNELLNCNYPDYPHNIKLCDECIKNIVINGIIAFEEWSETKPKTKRIFCPINNKSYYCDENNIAEYEKLFENCRDVDFTEYRYEYSD
jgi:hypothetical protein